MKTSPYMKSNVLLRCCLFISLILVIAIYFNYRPFSWPVGLEALGCLISLFILIISVSLLWAFRNASFMKKEQKNLSLGLAIGLLWTIEIGINNLIQPGLPLRDIIDDQFWAVIALLILFFAGVEAFKKKNISAGIISGFWSGTGSGAIACLTALLLIVFGMDCIINDPLNSKEWSEISKTLQYPNIKVYFAYQTFAGALLHLTILGTVMGLILGVLGGIVGKSISYFSKQ